MRTVKRRDLITRKNNKDKWYEPLGLFASALLMMMCASMFLALLFGVLAVETELRFFQVACFVSTVVVLGSMVVLSVGAVIWAAWYELEETQ